MRSGWWKGSGLRSRPLITENITVFAPMPSASVSTATKVKPGVFRSMRMPNFTSCASCSSQTMLQTSRVSSATRVVLPNLRMAANRASSGGMPRSMLSCVSRSMCSRMSRSSSRSIFSRRVIGSLGTAHVLSVFLFRRAQNPRDRRGELVPLAGFYGQLATALCREPVILRAAVIFGGAFVGHDPAALDEAMEGRVERALFDLQDGVGSDFDGACDGVAVRRADAQGAKNQKVQCALQQLDAFLLPGSHSRGSVPCSGRMSRGALPSYLRRLARNCSLDFRGAA